jgi:hypothetical protein
VPAYVRMASTLWSRTAFDMGDSNQRKADSSETLGVYWLEPRGRRAKL